MFIYVRVSVTRKSRSDFCLYPNYQAMGQHTRLSKKRNRVKGTIFGNSLESRKLEQNTRRSRSKKTTDAINYPCGL